MPELHLIQDLCEYPYCQGQLYRAAFSRNRRSEPSIYQEISQDAHEKWAKNYSRSIDGAFSPIDARRRADGRPASTSLINHQSRACPVHTLSSTAQLRAVVTAFSTYLNGRYAGHSTDRATPATSTACLLWAKHFKATSIAI